MTLGVTLPNISNITLDEGVDVAVKFLRFCVSCNFCDDNSYTDFAMVAVDHIIKHLNLADDEATIQATLTLMDAIEEEVGLLTIS